MHWRVEMKMYNHDRTGWNWVVACWAFSAELAEIVSNAMNAGGQETRVIEPEELQKRKKT